MNIPPHSKLGCLKSRVQEWQPYGTAYEKERDAMQLAGHLLLFKSGTRVVSWGGYYHVEVWERGDLSNEIKETIE